MTTKCFVLDTSVLLHNPNAIKAFDDNKVILPIYTIEEIDTFKKEQNELGRNARHIARTLDGLREMGDIMKGVPIGGGILQVKVAQRPIPPEFVSISRGADSKILAVALETQECESCPVILVTKDINLRIRGAALGITTVDFISEFNSASELYTGSQELVVDAEDIDLLFQDKVAPMPDTKALENSFGVLCDGASKSALVRFYPSKKEIRPIRGVGAWGINAKNKEQNFAFELLADKNIQLVTLVGRAGSGKTLLALASGLQQVAEEKTYTRMLVSRPIYPLGRDIGFLPGDVNEKMRIWMQPIYDNLEFLMGLSDKEKKGGRTADEFFDMGLIEVEPLTYIRGRSIPNQFIVIDECFPYNQKVIIDGKKRRIGTIFGEWVRETFSGKILSFNEKEGKFEYKRVLDIQHKGKRSLLKVTVGNKQATCTKEHPFLTTKGWVAAKDLCDKDDVVLYGSNMQNSRWLNDDQIQVVIGSYLGDGSLSKISEGAYRLAVIHGIKQEQYLEHKASIFKREENVRIIKENGFAKTKAKAFSTRSFGLPFEATGRRKETCEDWALENINAKGLAIWFMDDGSKFTNNKGARFHTESFSLTSCKKIVKVLADKFSIEASVKHYRKYNYIALSSKGYYRLCELIAPFVHPSMSYKIHDYQILGGGKYYWDNSYKDFAVGRVTNIEFLEERKHVFDIEVEDNHNFVACMSSSRGNNYNGFVVHNCQNASPHMIKTIITRAGEGSKIVLVGDIEQIDNPYIDSTNNGLTHVVNRFKGHRIFGHVTLEKGERSGLAETAASLL